MSLNDGVVKITLELLAVSNQFHFNVSSLDDCSVLYLDLDFHPLHSDWCAQEQKFCQRYDQLMEAWEKKVERIENNPRRRAKESKVREYYEKQFPEIRKQREMQERMQK